MILREERSPCPLGVVLRVETCFSAVALVWLDLAGM